MRVSSVILLIVGFMLLGAAFGYVFVGAGFVSSDFGAMRNGDASGS